MFGRKKRTSSLPEIPRNGAVIVEFWASWCGPSQYLKQLKEFADEASVTLIRIDVDQHQSEAEKYGISRIPALLYFVDGEKIALHQDINLSHLAYHEIFLRLREFVDLKDKK